MAGLHLACLPVPLKEPVAKWGIPPHPPLDQHWRLCLAVFNRLLMDHQSTGGAGMTVAGVPEPSLLWQAIERDSSSVSQSPIISQWSDQCNTVLR